MNTFFIQGLQHPFLTPSHIIVLLSLAILLGQQVPLRFNQLWKTPFAFLLTMSVGAWMQRHYPIQFNIEQTLLALAAILALLIAIKLKLSLCIFLLIALLCGFLIGQDSAPVMIPGLKISKVNYSLTGSVISASLFLAGVAAVASLLRNVLQGIPLRVLGSWIFAIAIMALSLPLIPQN